jgi:hypothetical protein
MGMKTILPIAVLGVSLISGCVVSHPQPVVVQPTTTTSVYRTGYVVTTLPTGYRTVRVNRNNYYVDRDVYYRDHPRGGYVVVERPL